MDPYKASGEINSQYVYSKNGTRFRVVEDPDEIEKIIRSHANTFPSSSSQYVYSKNGTRFRVVEDPSEIAKLSNSFSESQQSTVDQSSTPDSSPLDGKDWSKTRAVWSHLMSGLTAGYSDEIQAGNEAGFTDYWSGDKKAEEIYNRRVAKERAYQKALEEKHPWLSSGAYIAGSILPTIASFGIPALNFLRAGSTLGGLGRGALVGAGSGALHGSGAGEGYNDTVNSALAGGVGGAVLTPVAALGGIGISKAVRSLGNALKSPPLVRNYFNPAHKEVSNKALREVAKQLYDNKTQKLPNVLAQNLRKYF